MLHLPCRAMLPMPRASKKLSLPSPASNCCAIGAVEPTAAVFLVQCDAVVTNASVSQSYGAVAAGAVTNRRGVASRGGCCAGIACCRSAAACSGGRCCAGAALLCFLRSKGAFFCCIGSGRACALNAARRCCSRSRNKKPCLFLFLHSSSYIDCCRA